MEIERNPKRCGGDPVLAGTRMGVHDLVSYRRLYDGAVQPSHGLPSRAASQAPLLRRERQGPGVYTCTRLLPVSAS